MILRLQEKLESSRQRLHQVSPAQNESSCAPSDTSLSEQVLSLQLSCRLTRTIRRFPKPRRRASELRRTRECSVDHGALPAQASSR
jgi:hypothetical protein